MEMNWIAIIVAALVPMVLGFVWYSPKLFQNSWMKEARVTEDMMKGANMGLIFGVSFFLSFVLALFVNANFIHQNGLMGLVYGDPNVMDATSEIGKTFEAFKSHFANAHRTFTHGIAHGIMFGIMFVLPVLGTNALFERKGWKYILINVGYWTVCLAIMGGIICAWQ